ncbi:MAG: UvrD-helicase domain-containing protein [Firmicutes bacterium]|nr:UvrD-helicase domain-containing protein [[Eubacterium] siraeum]MCM1486878.1 UvrD-helicase domain-containing protein [Bacillota bacterium]
MNNFTEIKKQCIDRFFSRTNDKQREAVYQTEGAVLIIAGAGSGKTTVLCNRIANLILFGSSYNTEFQRDFSPDDEKFLTDFANGDIAADHYSTEKLSALLGYERAAPWKILAVTFTNKAAGELKERLNNMNANAERVFAGTFHAACAYILRRGIEGIGYKSSFTIYDQDDSLRVIKDVMKYLNISDKAFAPKEIQSKISHAKDKLITPDRFSVAGEGGRPDFKLEKVKDVYAEYQKRLKAANALDFDDMIMKTVQLFEACPEVLERWQKSFDYIMVDEYQDTNTAQYKLVSMLAEGTGNLCVVGDEDQSIYRFRGATIENILSFEKEFKARVVKLEQNYRSTETILDAANSVICNNTQRKGKNLWSDLGEGDKIQLQYFQNEIEEASFIAAKVMELKGEGGQFKDNAVLYRTNAQSRSVELALSKSGVPYRIIGGTKFYDRKEIKDIIAYMSVANNPFDTVRLARIINEPKRGLGEATQGEVFRIAEGLGLSPVEVMERSEEFASLAKKAKTLEPLGRMFRELGEDEDRPLDSMIDDILAETGYEAMLLTQGDEGQGRLENIRELKSGVITFMEENEDHSLSDYLENIALITDLDNYDRDEDKVVLMTMHGAKGLEFPNVFIAGAEENIFPSYRAQLDAGEIEEERRLAYVAITRAKERLFITHTKQRLLYGSTQRNKLSRFILEIPERDLEIEDHTYITAEINPERAKRPAKTGYLQQEARHSQVEKLAARISAAHSVPQSFASGERVHHKIFGDGTVLTARAVGNDHLLEIDFDKVGMKKIMANFAKIEKI